MNKIPELDNLG